MKVCWLLEHGSPPTYYCGLGEWCSNTLHAIRFTDKKQAHAVARAIGQELFGSVPNVIQHVFISQ